MLRVLSVSLLWLVSLSALAQTATQATPPPSDLEPGVNTSAPQPSSSEQTPAASSASRPHKPVKQVEPTPTSPAPADTTAPAPVAKTAAGAAAPKTGAPAGKAHDNLSLDTTQITGNRELPKVLYIVPWKRSELGDLVGKPVNSLLDEVLAPVDRDVFKRQNRYYDALKPDAGAQGPGAGQPPTGAAGPGGAGGSTAGPNEKH